MSSVHSVQASPDIATLGPLAAARVGLLASDPFGAFARAAARESVRRLTIVSPWIADGAGGAITFRELVARVLRSGGSVVLVTRPPSSPGHAAAVTTVSEAARGTVYFNPRLHAKLYVCEARRRGGFAVVGSANATSRSASLEELALIVRPAPGSRIVKHLAGPVIRGLISTRSTRL